MHGGVLQFGFEILLFCLKLGEFGVGHIFRLADFSQFAFEFGNLMFGQSGLDLEFAHLSRAGLYRFGDDGLLPLEIGELLAGGQNFFVQRGKLLAELALFALQGKKAGHRFAFTHGRQRAARGIRFSGESQEPGARSAFGNAEGRVQILDHDCCGIIRERSLKGIPDIRIHVQEVIQISDHAVAADAGAVFCRIMRAVPVAQRHEGAFARADAFEALHAVHRIVAAVYQNVLQRIVEVILQRGFVGGIGFNMVGKRFCLDKILAGDPRRQKFLNAFGIVAAPPLDFLQRGIPVLHQAVFIDLGRHFFRDLLHARGQFRRARFQRLQFFRHLVLPHGFSREILTDSLKLRGQFRLLAGFNLGLVLQPRRARGNSVQPLQTARLQVFQIRQPARTRQKEVAQFVDLCFRLANGFLQDIAFGPFGFQRPLFDGNLLFQNAGSMLETFNFAQNKLFALRYGGLFPIQLSGARNQSQFLRLLVFEHVLRVARVHSQAGELFADLVDDFLLGAALRRCGLPCAFGRCQFREKSLLLFLSAAEARGALRQLIAQHPLFHPDFQALNGTQLFAQPAVASCLGSLAAKGIQLPDHLPDDVLCPNQVLLRLLQLHLRGIAAAFKQGNPRSFFNQGAPFRRF